MSSRAPLSKRINLQLDCPHHSLQEPLKGILAACFSQLTVMTLFPGIFQGTDTMRTKACVCSDAVIPGGINHRTMDGCKHCNSCILFYKTGLWF